MSKHARLNPNPTRIETITLPNEDGDGTVVGTPDGNAVVVALGPNGVYVSFKPSSGRIMRKTGKGIACAGGAEIAANLADLGYYRLDQLSEATSSTPTFRLPAGIVAE